LLSVAILAAGFVLFWRLSQCQPTPRSGGGRVA
jgi:hypothetical protein